MAVGAQRLSGWRGGGGGRDGGYYALCAVLASWAVLTLVVGYNVPFLGGEVRRWRSTVGALRGGDANNVPPAEQTPPFPANHIDDTPVPATAHCGNDRVVVPRARDPFNAAPRRGGSDCAHIRGAL